MQRLFWLFSILLFTCLCTQRSGIEKTIENGVEIVINKIEPYKVKGISPSITLNEKFKIDTGKKELFDKGMGSAGEFVVDPQGNIYIVGFKNINHFIFKFSSTGHFVTSFARRGQGPGEIEWPMRPFMMESDQIALTDARKKLVIYSTSGEMIKEIPFKIPIMYMEILPNGKFLVSKIDFEQSTAEYYPYSLEIYNSDFKSIKAIDRVLMPSPERQHLIPYFVWRVSDKFIYSVSEDRGYEILVHDFEGNLIRKIRKIYKSTQPSDDIRRQIIGDNFKDFLKINKNYFPDFMPPLNHFFTDENGSIFVMTYESGKKEGEYLYDIFNPEGVFIGRTELSLNWAGMYFGPKYYTVRNHKLYCYRENEDGFPELIVYEIGGTW